MESLLEKILKFIIAPLISKEKTKEKSFSKRAIIDAGMKDGNGYLTPLYADVTITLRPASSYSDNTIINFSSNTGKGYFNLNMEKMRKDLIEEQKTQKTDKERNRALEDLDKRIEEDSKLYRPEEEYEEEPLPTPPPPIPAKDIPAEPSSHYNNGDYIAYGKNGDVFGGE